MRLLVLSFVLLGVVVIEGFVIDRPDKRAAEVPCRWKLCAPDKGKRESNEEPDPNFAIGRTNFRPGPGKRESEEEPDPNFAIGRTNFRPGPGKREAMEEPCRWKLCGTGKRTRQADNEPCCPPTEA